MWWKPRTCEDSQPARRLLRAPQWARGSRTERGLPLGQKWSGSILNAELQDFLMGWVWGVSGRGEAQMTADFFLPNKATRMQLTSTKMGSGCGEQGCGSRGRVVTALLWIRQVQDDLRRPRGDAEEAGGFGRLMLKGQFQAASEKRWPLRPRTRGGGGGQVGSSQCPPQGRLVWHLGKIATPGLWPLQVPSRPP